MQDIDPLEKINVSAELKEAALEFIKNEVEKKYNVKVLFCAESGSRGYHTHTDQSDMDVKGFYVSKAEDYLTVGDKKKILQKTHHYLQLKNGSQVEFDFTFLDIRKFLKRKLRSGKIDQMNLWAMSECVYLNNLDDDTYHFFQKELKQPYVALNGHMKTYLKIFQKENPTLKAKEILTCIIVGAQLLHMILFKENPIYQTWKQQNHLIKYAQKLKENNQEIPLPLKNLEYIKMQALQLYEFKKDARKGELDTIEPQIIEWMKQVIEFYKEFSNKDLEAEYSNSPEISKSRANEIFERMRNLVE